MKTIRTIQNAAAHPLIQAIKLTLAGGFCIALLACGNPDSNEVAAAPDIQTDESKPESKSNFKTAVMNHDDMKDMNDMNHKQMSNEEMNSHQPAEALGQDYSIYQVGGDWTDHNGKTFELDKLKGKNQVVVMAYTSCQHTCPILVQSMKQIYKEMEPEVRTQTEFLLVTLDTERDTVDVMKNFAEHNELGDNWRLIRSDEASTRMLANTLNIKYQFADNGDINHSNLISILDKEGRLVGQGVGVADSGIKPLINYLNDHS